jgi:hypothetical protein
MSTGAPWSLERLKITAIREGIVELISEERPREILHEEAASFQTRKTWKKSHNPRFGERPGKHVPTGIGSEGYARSDSERHGCGGGISTEDPSGNATMLIRRTYITPRGDYFANLDNRRSASSDCNNTLVLNLRSGACEYSRGSALIRADRGAAVRSWRPQ